MMQIMERIIFEYILCYLAQCFIIMLGVYAFCRSKIAMPQYLFGVGIVFVGSVLVRNLPLSYGVHTLFIMMITALVSIWYLKFPINRSIRSALFMTLILFVGEIGNMLFLNLLLGKERFAEVITNTVSKFVYGIPATILSLIITLVYYLVMENRRIKKPENPLDEIQQQGTDA